MTGHTAGQRIFSAITFLVVLSTVMAVTARTEVMDESYGNDLIEGTVNVSFIVELEPNNFLSFPRDAMIQPGNDPLEATASSSGTLEWGELTFEWSFEFSLTGETSSSSWTLTNSSPDPRVFIQSVIFYQGYSGILFDEGSAPSTPGSGPGISPAIRISGPEITTTSFQYPWDDPLNTGDMYTSVLVGWVELPNYQVFPPGSSAEFTLDSDIDLAHNGVLETQDDCPGEMTFTASSMTPNSMVVFLYSRGEDDFRIPSGSPFCGDLLLGLKRNTLKIGEITSADNSGTATWTVNVPGLACGRIFLQAVDLYGCRITNVLGL